MQDKIPIKLKDYEVRIVIEALRAHADQLFSEGERALDTREKEAFSIRADRRMWIADDIEEQMKVAGLDNKT